MKIDVNISITEDCGTCQVAIPQPFCQCVWVDMKGGCCRKIHLNIHLNSRVIEFKNQWKKSFIIDLAYKTWFQGGNR